MTVERGGAAASPERLSAMRVVSSVRLLLKSIAVLFLLLLFSGPLRADTPEYPLHDAARFGRTAEVKAMLADGWDVEARDRGNWTPLVWAAAYLHDDTLRVLIDAGADLEVIGRAGKNSGTALMWAAKKAYSHDTVLLLLDAGADPNGTDQYGRTALMMAAHSGEVENMRLLIERGADVNMVNTLPQRHGRTALEIARKWRQTTAENLLLDAGALEWPVLVTLGLAPAANDNDEAPAAAAR